MLQVKTYLQAAQMASNHDVYSPHVITILYVSNQMRTWS